MILHFCSEMISVITPLQIEIFMQSPSFFPLIFLNRCCGNCTSFPFKETKQALGSITFISHSSFLSLSAKQTPYSVTIEHC